MALPSEIFDNLRTQLKSRNDPEMAGFGSLGKQKKDV